MTPFGIRLVGLIGWTLFAVVIVPRLLGDTSFVLRLLVFVPAYLVTVIGIFLLLLAPTERR